MREPRRVVWPVVDEPCACVFECMRARALTSQHPPVCVCVFTSLCVCACARPLVVELCVSVLIRSSPPCVCVSVCVCSHLAPVSLGALHQDGVLLARVPAVVGVVSRDAVAVETLHPDTRCGKRHRGRHVTQRVTTHAGTRLLFDARQFLTLLNTSHYFY